MNTNRLCIGYLLIDDLQIVCILIGCLIGSLLTDDLHRSIWQRLERGLLRMRTPIFTIIRQSENWSRTKKNGWMAYQGRKERLLFFTKEHKLDGVMHAFQLDFHREAILEWHMHKSFADPSQWL